ncbi:uracil-DNA glycosylase [Microbacterium sp. W4I4]|uniref:uracil-DNA glycosylase n=1 Tax=Microbacterium sp. W4I4 TaxID=3042295 RepID=UPI0027865B61|nr:uracil-DNA glycosylase [Microbacterium sp. W4I4]MDQ0614418.1 uracil-DNA glycosylase [Microbacterium sp. W4I4]
MISTAPRSLGQGSVLEARRAMTQSAPTAAPLTRWVKQLIVRRLSQGLPAEIPMVDPADAGTEAQVLLLLEAPGPMTNAQNARAGSGFISSDNNDATAENLWRARQDTGLVGRTLLWNIVPWYLGPASNKPKVADLCEGAGDLRELIAMLPELHTVVTLGHFPRRGWSRFGRPGLGIGIRTIESWHPSPLAMNQPGKRDEMHAALARASRDWRRDDAGGRETFSQRDRSGQTVARWYFTADGDRVDVHPRWW